MEADAVRGTDTRAGRARGLRGPLGRAVRVRDALARRLRPRRRGGAGDLRPRLARRRALRPRGRLPAHLAVRDPAQRRDRPQPPRRRTAATAPAGPAAAAPGAAGAAAERAVEPLEQALLAWQVEEALRRIGEDHRRVLLETHFRGRPHNEGAAELGGHEGTVKSRVYYGLKAMRVVLEEMGYED